MDYVQDRKLKILLLTKAKDELSAEVAYSFFICSALLLVGADCLEQYSNGDIINATNWLRTYIRHALQSPAYPSVSYYDEWVLLNHPKRFDEMRGEEFLQGRIAWINWMIACYEEDIANYKKDKE